MAGAAPMLDLPIDYSRPEKRSVKGAQDSIQLSENLSKAIGKLSRQEGVTLFMTLLAAFQTLLFRYSGQEDIVVGSPVAGRSMLETEDLIGSFVNTLVLRADFAGQPSFREFLGRVRAATLGAFLHQDVPFEKLVEEKTFDPLFVTHCPKELVPLAKQNAADSSLVDVYELIINGVEMSPGYTELNDPDVQRQRLLEQAGEETQKIDEDFLLALEHGMPPAGGFGLGIDRLAMLFTGAESIRDVILFPLLKPKRD